MLITKPHNLFALCPLLICWDKCSLIQVIYDTSQYCSSHPVVYSVELMKSWQCEATTLWHLCMGNIWRGLEHHCVGQWLLPEIPQQTGRPRKSFYSLLWVSCGNIVSLCIFYTDTWEKS